MKHVATQGNQVREINRVKSVCIRIYSGLRLPAFGLNTDRYVFIPNGGKCGPE